jgi:prepilin-type processing-associated H-X9-DG protein
MHQIGIAVLNYEATTNNLPGQQWPYYALQFAEQENNNGSNPVQLFLCPSRHTGGVLALDYGAGSQPNSFLYAVKLSNIVNQDGTANTMMIGELSASTDSSSTNYPTGIRTYSYPPSNGISYYVPTYDYGRNPIGDTAQADGATPGGTPKTITLYSLYDPSRNGFSYDYQYNAQTNTYTYTYYIDNAKTKPYFYEYITYTYSPSYSFSYAYAENLTNPPQTVSVTLPQPNQLGFGSEHPGGMNILMCDGSVRRFNYGTKGLGQVIGYNDGTPNWEN